MVRSTSKKAYKEIIEEGLLGRQEELVFEAYHKQPNSTDREISEEFDLKINVVTARRNELVKKGCIIDTGTTYDVVTGRTAHTWKIPKTIHYHNIYKKSKGMWC